MVYREMKRSKKKLRALLLAGLIAVSSIYTAGCGDTSGTVVDNSAVNQAAKDRAQSERAKRGGSTSEDSASGNEYGKVADSKDYTKTEEIGRAHV